MKIYVCFIMVLLTSFSKAQIQILVTMDHGKIVLPNDLGDAKIPLPFSFIFDEAFFRNKTITFYSGKNDSKKILNAKFGSGDLLKKVINNKSVFEVKIKDNKTIDLKQSEAAITSGRICFKINQSGYSDELIIGEPANATNTNADKKPGYDENILHSGFIIDDALILNEKKDKRRSVADSNAIRSILRAYGINDSDKLVKNYFLNSVLDSALNNISGAGIQTGGIGLSAAFSSIGGLDVTSLADGLAKFIVKRAKKELSIAFFKKFKEDLEKYPDLKTVFPATHTILTAIDHEIYNYSNYIKNLREAFRSDLKEIDKNLPGMIKNHSAFFATAGNFELGLALRTGCYVSSSLKHDMHPGDILDAYPVSYFDNPPSADKAKLDILKGSIQALQLLNESLKEGDVSKNSYWVGMDKIRQVVSDKSAFKIYLGLLLQVAHIKYDNVQFSATNNLYELLNTSANVTSFDKTLETYASYKQYILNFGSKVDQLNKMIKEYEAPATDSLKVEQFAKYFQFSSQLIEYCVEVSKLPVIKNVTGITDIDEQTKKYFEIADEATAIVIAINRKNYAEAGNHVIAIYRKIIVDPAADPAAGRVAALLVKYASFMSNLVNAKTSDEVASAIEDAALPVGSSSIKRETPFNVSLNAYAGFFVGHEYINKINDKHGINSYGATAPVGVAISWGKKCGWSSSLFISLVDLGAVAAYRVNNDSIAQVPTIQLKDIFSPGAFLSIGFPKTPISFNVGAQFGPNLRKVTDAKNDYSNKSYVRFSASICVDIPILNLYTKPKK